MTDTIVLRGLECLAYCGALPEEQLRRQPFHIDLELDVDVSRAAASDELADTVDYGTLCDRVVHLMESERFVLMERAAQRIADVVLEDARVSRTSVTIEKVRPPVPHHLLSAAVRIERERR
jgi:dihydroneopterin aldolase